MKILFLTKWFYPHIGGVEKHVMEISKRLVKLGHEVTVVAENATGFIRPPLADRSTTLTLRGAARRWPLEMTTYRIPVGKNERLKKFQVWWWLWKNRKLINEADIVHAHDVGYWWFPFKILYPQKPFFMTFHGYEEYPVPFKNKIIHKISEKIAKGNICVGDFLEKWYGTKATYTTYGGVRVQSSKFKVQNHNSKFNILFVGRLDEQTGIMTYVRVFRGFRGFSEFENYELVIAGDGKLRKEVESFAKENYLVVRVLGDVRDAGEMRELREKARFVFASGYLSILEAMAAQKLVFSVYDNPLKEDYLRLAKFAKFVVICGNEKELVEKMKFYLENPEQEKKMVEKGYEWIKTQTWEKVVEGYLGVWKR